MNTMNPVRYAISHRCCSASASYLHLPLRQFMSSRYVATAKPSLANGETDPRLADLGKRIHDEYAHVKDHYGKAFVVFLAQLRRSLSYFSSFLGCAS